MDPLKVKAGPVDVLMLPGCRIAARTERGEAFEPESLAAWAEMVIPGQAAFDIGAYTGLYAVAAAKLGGAAYAFEPMPDQCARLKDNADLNGAKIALRRCAVSDVNGAEEFRFNGSVPLTSGGSLAGRGSHVTMVITRRLDDLDLPPVAAIKIDVERAEDRVLRGAVRIVAEWRPQIIAEVLESAAVERLAALLPGYRLKRLLDGRNAWLAPA